VDEVQRTRILEAMAETLAERGADSASIGEVLARTGVPAGVFDEAFADREACLLAALDLAAERARTRMAPGYYAHSRWLDAIKAALVAFLAFVEDEPALGRLLVVYSTSGGEQVMRRRVQFLAELADVIDRGRLEGPGGRQQPPLVIAEGVVGAVLAVLGNRLLVDASSREHQHPQVMDLFGSLVSIIVLPYLGAGVARRELERPAPSRTAGARMLAAQSALSPRAYGTSARLTYRTARVLSAIGDYPGASNREIADRAGIIDQGQISKLLGRLRERGLIAKMGTARSRGAPNSWRLTERGELVLQEISAMAGAGEASRS